MWLGLFPIPPRSDILNHVLRTLRRQAPTTPEDLATLIRHRDPAHRLAGEYPVEEMIRLIDENPVSTLMFCEWAFAWNALPQTERDQQRADDATRFQRLPRQPGRVTPEQAAQLAELGRPGVDPTAPDAPAEEVADFDVVYLARRRLQALRGGGR